MVMNQGAFRDMLSSVRGEEKARALDVDLPPQFGRAHGSNLRVALVGRPNAGCSTLFNAFCGRRAAASGFPGETRRANVGRTPHATEAYEALRDGGGTEEAKEADSPVASPRAKPPPRKQSKRFRCATCGKRFSSHLALRAHSVEHPKAKDDEDRRAAARARGAAPKVDEDDEPPKPRRRRPERSNGGFEAFDRRRSAEARARGGATVVIFLQGVMARARGDRDAHRVEPGERSE